MKLYMACTVCSVRRAHGAGYGRAEHMCSRVEPLGVRGLLLNAQGDVMAARGVGIRQEGVNPCRVVPSKREEEHVQLHEVTGKVQNARAASCRAGVARVEKKVENKSKPRFRVNRIPQLRGERPPFWGTGYH